MAGKNIVILSPAHPLRGGIAISSERFAKELQKEGHEVIIYSYSLQYPGFLFPGSTQFTSDPPPKDINIKTCVNSVNPLNWIKVGLKLRKLQPDLIITRYWLPFMGPCLGTILRIAGANGTTKRIALADNILPHEKRPGDKIFTRWFVGANDGFLVMSDSVREDLSQFTDTKPVEYVPHPIYDNYGDPVERQIAIEKLGLAPQTRFLLFFGFIRDYKGLDLLLKAMADPEVKELDVHLIVAGEYYGNQQMYENLIHELGIEDRLVLRTQYIPAEDIKYYFAAADLVVQPYKSATQSGISQIAYHFEKPMIVTRVGGLPEIVPDGIAGYVVDVNAKSVSQAVVAFYKQNKLNDFSKGIIGGKHRFSWKNMVSGMELVMRRIV
jgi:glycosyltransferase involved in cell wall biosynthesis